MPEERQLMQPEDISMAISSAAAGDRVAIFTENLRHAAMLARDFEDKVPQEYVEKLSRTSGRNAIHFHSGGSIRFISTRQSARGISLDRAYVPFGAPSDTEAAIIPALATSKSGVLTWY